MGTGTTLWPGLRIPPSTVGPTVPFLSLSWMTPVCKWGSGLHFFGHLPHCSLHCVGGVTLPVRRVRVAFSSPKGAHMGSLDTIALVSRGPITPEPSASWQSEPGDSPVLRLCHSICLLAACEAPRHTEPCGPPRSWAHTAQSPPHGVSGATTSAWLPGAPFFFWEDL